MTVNHLASACTNVSTQTVGTDRLDLKEEFRPLIKKSDLTNEVAFPVWSSSNELEESYL